jgi:hypothetical protein
MGLRILGLGERGAGNGTTTDNEYTRTHKDLDRDEPQETRDASRVAITKLCARSGLLPPAARDQARAGGEVFGARRYRASRRYVVVRSDVSTVVAAAMGAESTGVAA